MKTKKKYFTKKRRIQLWEGVLLRLNIKLKIQRYKGGICALVIGLYDITMCKCINLKDVEDILPELYKYKPKYVTLISHWWSNDKIGLEQRITTVESIIKELKG